MKKALVSLALLAALVPLTAQAATFLSGENFRETTEAVPSDLFIASSTVAVLHAVRDDVFAAGENVSIDAPVGGDIIAAGNSVHVNGRAGDDVMVAGNTVQVRAEEVDDIMAAGSTVEIADTTVAGSVLAAGERVRISGTIAGDVRVAGQDVVIASGTRIAGDVLTLGEREPVIEEGVTIGGRREHEAVERDHSWEGRFSAADWVRSVITWFIAGVLLLYLLRGAAAEVVETAFTRSGRSLGLGALAAVLVLPAAVLLAITIVGLPLAALVLLGTPVHLIIAHTLAAVIIGAWIMRRFSSSTTEPGLRWQHVLLGAVVLKTIGLVPIVGDLACAVLTLLAWGAMLSVFWRRMRAPSQPVLPGA
jgi:hypothetical protein